MPREKIYPSASNASGKPLVAVDTASVSSRGGPRRKRTRRRRRGTFRSQEGRGKPRTVTAGGVRTASAAPQLGAQRSWSEPLLCASGSLISHASALAQLWPVFAVEGCGPPATLEREIPLFLLGSRPVPVWGFRLDYSISAGFVCAVRPVWKQRVLARALFPGDPVMASAAFVCEVTASLTLPCPEKGGAGIACFFPRHFFFTPRLLTSRVPRCGASKCRSN